MKGHSIPLLLLFQTEVSGVIILENKAGVSLYSEVSLVYTQFNSMNCWQCSCYGNREKTLSSSRLSAHDFTVKT